MGGTIQRQNLHRKKLYNNLEMASCNEETEILSQTKFLDAVAWNSAGLVPAIVQCYKTQQVLMLAWMNRDSLKKSLEERRTVFWSRSRRTLWYKGETSGAVQRLRELRLDCDGDALLLAVEQQGSGACHTGRPTCFFRKCDRQGYE